MRYYEIIITNPNNNNTVVQKWSTLNADGSNNLSSQSIEFDIPVYTTAEEIGSTFIKIHGVPITEIGQAFNLNNMNLQFFAGMSAGLPLANPNQSGLIIQGVVQQAFGNWEGIDMNITLQVISGWGTSANAKNLIFNWIKGSSLTEAIRNTLSIPYPTYQININVNPNLALSNTEYAFYQTVPQFARYLNQVSKYSNQDSKYQGIKILMGNNTFTVYDGSSKSIPKELSFNDLIGQPIWQSLNQIQFRTVLRADINVGDYVNLPKGIATNTPQSFSRSRDNSVFQGEFQIDSVRHLGNYRGMTGQDWITVFTAHLT